ncbi:MAG: ribulose-phosphate 3-epimerase [Bacteroidetes bacterium]|nr:ribulose-phosphate 3-epimerase [Bacteroidota bacterium]
MNQKIVAPSLLSADFTNLKEQINNLQIAGCKMFHCDIMDGHFVPNISFGPSIVSQIHKCTTLPLDTHLMISEPEKYIRSFSKSGSSIITVHYEACQNLGSVLELIKIEKLKVGVSIKPKTHVSVLEKFINQIDLILIMSVEPGFGGQEFIPSSYKKIEQARELITKNNFNTLIEVDGGITFENIQNVSDAGADIFVAGNTIFKKADYVEAFINLQKLIS